MIDTLIEMPKDAQYLIGVRAFARLPEVGVAPKNVVQAMDDGKITAVRMTGKGRQLIMPQALEQWLASRVPGNNNRFGELAHDGEQSIAAGSPEAIDYLYERARLTRLQADKTDLEIKAFRLQLLYREDVEEMQAEMVTAARARLMSLSARLAAELAPKTNLAAQEIEQAAAQIVREALAELAEFEEDEYRTVAKRNGHRVIGTAVPNE